MSLLKDKDEDFLSEIQHCKIIDSRWQILQEHRGFLSFTIALSFIFHSTLIWCCLFVCWYKCVDLSPHSGCCSQIGGWVIWCWLIEIKKSHESGNPKRQIVANWSKTRRLCPENCTSFRAISWQTDFIFNPQLTSCKLRGAISALSSSEQIANASKLHLSPWHKTFVTLTLTVDAE